MVSSVRRALPNFESGCFERVQDVDKCLSKSLAHTLQQGQGVGWVVGAPHVFVKVLLFGGSLSESSRKAVVIVPTPV